MQEGYADNDDFIFIERADYERWVETGSEAYHASDRAFNHGEGADNIDDQRNQLTDTITAMLHFGRVNGLIDKTFTAEAALQGALLHFNAENPPRLRAWQKDLREL